MKVSEHSSDSISIIMASCKFVAVKTENYEKSFANIDFPILPNLITIESPISD
jgi:hypothetical protein